jgi:hypothetical protein
MEFSLKHRNDGRKRARNMSVNVNIRQSIFYERAHVALLHKCKYNVEVSVLPEFGVPSLDDWCSKFRENVASIECSFSRFEP